jgi:hypothetical protein
MADMSEMFEQAKGAWADYLSWTERVSWPAIDAGRQEPAPENPLRKFFEARHQGHGIWKWIHYFDIYDRHFRRFRGQEVHILDSGIYSGGSLEMWKDYFGSRCKIYGVDIEPSCAAYEGDSVRIFIGDQADRAFWRDFKRQVPQLDLVVDDGGHLAPQQIATFEELLPHLRRGGVFLCEDVHGVGNPFASYIHRLAHDLNNCENHVNNLDDDERRIVSPTSALQSAVKAVHLYPFVTVIERNDRPIKELVAPKHGTEWQPFLK